MTMGFVPATLEEALQIRREKKTIPVSGATDVMVQYRREGGLAPHFPDPPLFIHHLSELKEIRVDQDIITLGAGCVLSDLLKEPSLPGIFHETLHNMAAVTTRNVATIGGNICNASPAADTLPFLYLSDAMLVLQNMDEKREIPIKEFITGPGQTALQKDELLVAVRVPQKRFDMEYYRKVGTRKAMALSKISLAGAASFIDGKITDFRLALGAVAPKVIRDRELENQATGYSKEGLKNHLPSLVDGYKKHIQPIDDARSTAEYRRAVSLDLIRAFIEKKILTNADFR